MENKESHRFQLSSTGLCCGRNLLQHKCECCPSDDIEVALIDDMLMCASCQDRDAQIKAELAATQGNSEGTERDKRLAELTAKLRDSRPKDRRQYFVKRLASIVDAEIESVENGIPAYQFLEALTEHIAEVKMTIRNKHIEIAELQEAATADQLFLNMMVPKLRDEERASFKAWDNSYKPAAVAAPSVKARKPRMSKDDRMVESYAKVLGVSLEQAKMVMAKSFSNVTGNPCTCATTPGICKVHYPKG